MALVFLVAVSLLVLALMNWVGTSLTATGAFTSERQTENAATSAVNLAIQNSRFTFSSAMANAIGPDGFKSPAPCWGTGSSSSLTIDNETVDVWCSMLWQPFSAQTRTITYSACLTSVTTDPATCAKTPLLQAVEVFDDYPPGVGVPSANPVPCNVTKYCGQSITQTSWLWRPSIPSVTSISPTSALVTGKDASGQPVEVTVTGDGFVDGSSVNLLQETGPSPGPGVSPTTANWPTDINDGAGVVVNIPSAQVTWGGCQGAGNTDCTLRFAAPAVTSGSDYFVTVTTPDGTSAYVPTQNGVNADDLQYTPTRPTVDSISGPQSNGQVGGSITGGTVVTLSGSGFADAPNFKAQVWFWQNGTKAQANNVKVVDGGTVMAAAPAVSSAGTWYVQVDTLGGNSTSTSVLFDYGVQVPIITSLSPYIGSGGSTLTIYGGNFLTGSSVGFCADTNGSYSPYCVYNGYQQYGAAVQSLSASQIKVTVPNNMPAGTYYPVVSLPAPYNDTNTYPPSQPYNLPADIFTKN